MKPLRIGEVARRAGVGVETIRYYERRGLIEEPPRKESGYRQYPEGVVERLRFIKRAKQLGFSLGEIAELLSLRVGPSSTSGEVKQRALAKLADIDEKIRTLRNMRSALAWLVAACDGTVPVSECPILETLGGGEESPDKEKEV